MELSCPRCVGLSLRVRWLPIRVTFLPSFSLLENTLKTTLKTCMGPGRIPYSLLSLSAWRLGGALSTGQT